MGGVNDALAAIASGIAVAPNEKRMKLKPYDLLPGQVLNPMGVSGVETIPLDKLAYVQKKGNKTVPHFSELCDLDPKRKAIAMSRISEVNLKTGAKLELPVYKNNINAKLYNAAMAEFKVLKPTFEMLMGKGHAGPDAEDTVSSVIYVTASEYKETASVDEAAAKLHAWLMQPQSKWRSLVSLLSGGGVFYVASVHEKSHRAYIAHGEAAPVPVADYQKWCRLRLCGEGAAAISSDLDGL